MTTLKTPNNVLLVEDSKLLADRISEGLIEYGVKAVDHADNLQSGLDLTSKNEYDLYITDGNYPMAPGQRTTDGAGFIFIQELKEIKPDVAVIMLSLEERYEDRARELGAGFVSKSGDIIDALLEEYSKISK